MVDAIFLLAGLPLALVAWPLPLALGVSVVFSLAASLLAALAHLMTGWPIGVCWAVVVGLSAIPLLHARWRDRALRNLRMPWRPLELILLAVLSCLTFLLVFPGGSPPGWDTRSFWFPHAGWLLGPPSDYLDAQAHPILWFAHPSYPVVGSAAVAIAWQIAGSRDLIAGAQLVALLNLSVAWVCAQLLACTVPRPTSAQAIIVIATLCALTAVARGEARSNGYMDVLQALTVLATGLLLARAVFLRRAVPESSLLAVSSIVAVNVKQEGLPFVLALSTVAVILSVAARRPRWPPLVAVVAGIAGAVAWQVTVRQRGVQPPDDAGGIAGRLPELLQPGSTAWVAVDRVLTDYAAGLSGPFLAMVLLAIIALASARPSWTSLGPAILLGASAGSVLVVVLVTYSLGNTRSSLEEWLALSYTRINATLVALSIGGTAWALLHRVDDGVAGSPRLTAEEVTPL